MVAQKSPLLYKSFYVVGFDYKFKDSATNEPVEISQQNYVIEVDFLHREVQENSFDLYLKLEINCGGEKLPGYSFFVEALGNFELVPEGLSEGAVNNLTLLSPLTMLISSVRGFILEVSAHGLAGRYLLPSIDVYDLVNQKSKSRKRKAKTKADPALQKIEAE